MQMDAGLDTGAVLLRQETPIEAEETTGALHDRLSVMGAELIVEALAKLPDLKAVPQTDEGTCYAAKIDKAEAQIDWSLPADQVDQHIRGLSPFPGAWTLIAGDRVKCLGSRAAKGAGTAGLALDDLFTIACGTGAVQIMRAQRAGKGAQDTDVFLRGRPVPQGTQLGE